MEQTETVSSFRKFKRTQPKAVSLGQRDLVKKSPLSSGEAIPIVIEPQIDILDLGGWIQNNWESVHADLLKHGALLFRGFEVPDQATFKSVVAATSVPLMNYMEGATPRLFRLLPGTGRDHRPCIWSIDKAGEAVLQVEKR